MNEIFVDSNIILYLMDADDHKRSIAQQILSNKPFINSQVLTEVANVCKRAFKYEKAQILSLWTDLMSDCSFMDITEQTFRRSMQLVKSHDFQLFDALIVASALEANCSVLYSEDMQHNMKVENKLRIINPFV